jgi:hypothetical protein
MRNWILSILIVMALAAIVMIYLTLDKDQQQLPSHLPSHLPSQLPPSLLPREQSSPTLSAEPVMKQPMMVEATGAIDEGVGESVLLSDLSLLLEGDSLSLYIPQEGITVEGLVSDVATTLSGNRVITGQLSESDGTHGFIFTVGASYTSGTLQTATARYQLEIRNGAGRIVATSNLTKKIDYSKLDYVIPQTVISQTKEDAINATAN